MNSSLLQMELLISSNISKSSSDVAVLLPVYNCQNSIAACLNSLINQTYKEWVAVVVNDGSTDSTANIIDGFEDNRIIHLNLEKNTGLAEALNFGLSQINSRFIFRMDADDLMYPNRLAIQLNNISGRKIGVHSAGIAVNGKKILEQEKNSEQVHSLLSFCNPINHPTVLFDREYCGAIKYNPVACEDFDLWCRLANDGVKFHVYDDVVLNYKTSPSQKSVIENVEAMNEAAEIARRYVEKKFDEKCELLASVGFTFLSGIPSRRIIGALLNNLISPVWDDALVNKKFNAKLAAMFLKNALRR